MKVLLDTHALLWATLSPARLSPKASEILANRENVILVAAASAWEITTKVRLRELPAAELLERDFLAMMEGAGYTWLPIDVESALRAGRFTVEHQDPFDRMIAAQAIKSDIPMLSIDTNLDAFGVHRIW